MEFFSNILKSINDFFSNNNENIENKPKVIESKKVKNDKFLILTSEQKHYKQIGSEKLYSKYPDNIYPL